MKCSFAMVEGSPADDGKLTWLGSHNLQRLYRRKASFVMRGPWRRAALNDWCWSRRLASIQADPERNDAEGRDEGVDDGLTSLFDAIVSGQSKTSKAHSSM
jgi:hypothetical protein